MYVCVHIYICVCVCLCVSVCVGGGGGVHLVASGYKALGQLIDVVLHTTHIWEKEIGHHATMGDRQGAVKLEAQ